MKDNDQETYESYSKDVKDKDDETYESDSKDVKDKDDETYESYLKDVKEDYDNQQGLSESEQQKIVHVGKNTARNTTIMVSLAILLLIVPVLTLLSHAYYAIGGRANTLIDVVSKTIYVTEPNMSLEEMEIEEDVGFFSMNVLFDVYKRIGREDYQVGDYDVYFAFGESAPPEKNLRLDRPLPEWATEETRWLIHPDGASLLQTAREWNMLNKLPDGTVAEAYVSFSELASPDEVEALFSNDIEVRWLAVDTGFEAEGVDREGVPLDPIGYPAQIDSTTWSPFNGREQSNAEAFVDILRLLKEHENVAESVARSKTLELGERLEYIEENGINVYGAVVTGSVPELRKLEQLAEIRALKLGEVKLWNWE